MASRPLRDRAAPSFPSLVAEPGSGPHPMRIGIDLDNTIACYDRAFHRAAAARGLLEGPVAEAKTAVRRHLRERDLEDAWTELQGWVYGPGMAEAEPFPGVRDFLRACADGGLEVYVVSHRTRHPYRGPQYDLHAAARDWLDRSGLLDPTTGIDPARVFLETSADAKAERIARLGCRYWVDDLAEFLERLSLDPSGKRIHFDPSGRHEHSLCRSQFVCVGGWEEIGGVILATLDGDDARPTAAGRDRSSSAAIRATASRSSPLETVESEAIVALARTAGYQPYAEPEALSGGRNNRVYRLRSRPHDLLAKLFYVDPDARCDRFASEVAFSRFAWQRGIRCIPAPVASDQAARVMLTEYVEGTRLHASQIGPSEIDAAVEFAAALARASRHPDARTLPDAAEAAFSIDEHLELVASRVARLAELRVGDDHDAIDAACVRFVGDRLAPAWRRVAQDVNLGAQRIGLDPRRRLGADERVLSPSDFGFHNALATADGRVVFHDFEYAGWDDPAKMICDFFLQPEIPAPASFRERFTRAIAGEAGLMTSDLQRVELLAPVFRIKWCCIVLNEFLVHGRSRRAFAGAVVDRREVQLAKAAALLSVVEAGANGDEV